MRATPHNKQKLLSKKRLNFQHSTLTDVKILAYMALLPRKKGCILPKQYEQATKLAHDCQFLLGALIKNSKNIYKHQKSRYH